MSWFQLVENKISELELAKEKTNVMFKNNQINEALAYMKNEFLNGIDQILIDDLSKENLQTEFEETNRFTSEGIPFENLVHQMQDTLVHKYYVLRSCAKMATYLESIQKNIEAILLMRRAFVHDISKLNQDEFYGLATFAFDVASMTNKEIKRPSEEKLIPISLHWSRNSHHPEFHEKVLNMSQLDMIEMTCDWHARSSQFKTDLLEWAKDKFLPRFKFDEIQFSQIYDNCKILTSY